MLAKPKLNKTEVVTSKTLINSYISNNKFVLINNALRSYNDMKEEFEIIKILKLNQRFWSIYKTTVYYCLKCKKSTVSKKMS